MLLVNGQMNVGSNSLHLKTYAIRFTGHRNKVIPTPTLNESILTSAKEIKFFIMIFGKLIRSNDNDQLKLIVKSH